MRTTRVSNNFVQQEFFIIVLFSLVEASVHRGATLTTFVHILIGDAELASKISIAFGAHIFVLHDTTYSYMM